MLFLGGIMLFKNFITLQDYITHKYLLTLSNFAFIIPFLYAHDDDRSCIFMAGIFSIIHHSIEQRFVKDAIFDVRSELLRSLCLQLDRIGALTGILYLGNLQILFDYWIIISIALIFMLLSEIVWYLPYKDIKERHTWRTIFHVLWHLLALGYIPYLSVCYYSHEKRLYEYIK